MKPARSFWRFSLPRLSDLRDASKNFKPFSSIAFSITITYLLIFTLILSLVTVAFAVGFNYLLFNPVEKDLVSCADILCGLSPEDMEVVENISTTLAENHSMAISVFDAGSKTPVFTVKGNDTYPYVDFRGVFDKPARQEQGGNAILVLTRPFGNGAYFVQLTRYVQNESTTYLLVVNFVIITIILSLLLGLFLGYRVSFYLLRPIDDMTATIQEISVNNLSKRLSVVDASSELKDLALSFNSLFDEIQTNYERQSRFLSDASHELRTPISIIQGYADLLSRWGAENPQIFKESTEAILSESHHMSFLVDQLLFLARSDHDAIAKKSERFSLSGLCCDCIKEVRIISESRAILYRSPLSGEVDMVGDRAMIRQLIFILLDNAVKYTPENGQIVLQLSSDGENAVISVKDDGIGIPEEHIDKIFDRFYKADASRTKRSSGEMGLGLSIASKIAALHHGRLTVFSEAGKGSEFTFAVPLGLYESTP